MEIKAAIFDKDGTLFDTEHYYQEAWVTASKEMGFELTDEIRSALFGRSGKDQIQKFNDVCPSVDGERFVSRFSEMAQNDIMNATIHCKPGVIEILDYFQSKKIPMAVASGGSRWLIQKNLMDSHLADYFTAISSGLEVKYSKPYPDVFLDACDRLGKSPCECIVFEDSPNGVLAAHRAGCYTVLIPENKAVIQKAEGVFDQVFADFYEVLDWIKGYGDHILHNQQESGE